MKKCFKCGRCLPLSDFYKHPQMGDGHLNKCIDCTKRDSNENRRRNIDKIRQYDRDRSQTPERRAKTYQYQQNTYYQNPIKAKARYYTTNAIRDGRLIRPTSCSLCGKECKPEAHHSDYNKPLEVEWYCRNCHRKIHGALIGTETTDSQMAMNFNGKQ